MYVLCIKYIFQYPFLVKCTFVQIIFVVIFVQMNGVYIM